MATPTASAQALAHPPFPRPPRKVLFRHVLGGAAWAGLFSVTYWELWVLVIAGMIGAEFLRCRHFPFLPGFIARLSVGIIVLFLASSAPLKDEDTVRFTGLPTSPATLAALSSQGVKRGDYLFLMLSVPDEYKNTLVRFSSSELTLGQLVVELEAQTGLSASISRCDSGASILFGSATGTIRLDHAP